MVYDKICVFDTSALVYIYQHSDKSDAHELLKRYKNSLSQKFLLAKNDLYKDLPGPLQQKYLTRMSTLFSFEESPRDEVFEKIKQTALQNRRIAKEDLHEGKLTDIDVIRLGKIYTQPGEKKVLLVTDDEGIHNIVKDLGWEEEIEVLYTHLYFFKIFGYAAEEKDKIAINNNIQDSYYYTKTHLATSDRYLPYDKVLNTSLEILSKNYSQVQDKRQEQLLEQINTFLEEGIEKIDIKDLMPLLRIMRQKRTKYDYSTYQASLDLMKEMKKLLASGSEKCQLVTELVHKELANYHLELAYKEHKELNLVGALANIRATTQAMVFVDDKSTEFAKNLEELLFIEALLLLELGAEEEALINLQQFITTEKSSLKESKLYQDTAQALLMIFEKKVGRIKDESANILLELVREALMIPNNSLAIRILTRMLEEESISLVNRKKVAQEIFHLVNLRFLFKENPIVEKAIKLSGKEIEDLTNTTPDKYNLEKLKENFSAKEGEAYHGPWEIADIREKKQSYWIYAWNNRLKSFWVLDIKGKYPKELDKAKTITFLSAEILEYKNCTNLDDVKFRQRIVLKENPIFVVDEKRALSLW